jgi:signal transduction histidine kinase
MTLRSIRPTVNDMTLPEPQADHVPRETSRIVTRAASLGLAGVVLCLAAFSIVGAYTMQTEVARAQREDALHTSYGRAILAIRAEDTSAVEYLLVPSAQRRAAMTDATNGLINAINEIEKFGGEADSELVKEVMAAHDHYIAASARMVSAVAAGDTALALQVEVLEVDPIFDLMHAQIREAADGRAGDALSAFAELRSTARWILIESPVVFTIGFGILFGLWRILEASHRATRKTYREIEQLSKLRSEFVSIVSHEFRTPLTGIQGFSELMRDEELTPAQTREYAGDINKDARRLARLITDMLDLDRMESGHMTLISEPMDLNRIVADAAARFRLSAADHPIELDLDPRLPVIVGDSDRLTQVVSNLLGNAIKYSPSGGAVELRTERAARTVTLTVRDHGMGIPSEQLEKIFDRYSRLETTETRVIQGTGLGLPIVRQIVQLSGGRVWATSEAGQGSVLHVELPLLEATALPTVAAENAIA